MHSSNPQVAAVRRKWAPWHRAGALFFWLFLAVGPACAQDFSGVPGSVISYIESPSQIFGQTISPKYIGSPSITIMPDGSYIASHDIFGSGSSENTTKVFRSTNKGKTWTAQSTITGAFWSTIFQHNGALYLWGYREEGDNGDILIRKSTNNGATWTNPTSSTNGLLLDGDYGGTPNVPAVYNGRLWIAQSGKRVMSAPASSDLLLSSSWTLSNTANTDSGPLGSGLIVTEAQAVASPQTGVVLLPKVGEYPNTVLLRVNPGNPGQMIHPTNADWVSLPGGEKKFGAQYDPVSRMFYILDNPVLPVHKGVTTAALTRTAGALLASRDLLHWDMKKLFLFTPNIDNGSYGEGFQYFNFVIDGGDLAVASRTAFVVPGDNKPPRGHDSNLMTFHTIKDFRTATPAQVLVADSGNHRVLRYEATQTNTLAPLGKFTQGTTFDGAALNTPWGLAQNAKGEVFLSERVTGGRVLKFDASGNFLRVLATSGTDFTGTPESLAVGPDGFLFLSVALGSGSDKIYKIDPDFGGAAVFINTSFSGGSFSNPRGIAFGSDGNLYVADRDNDKIRKFNGATGAFVSDLTTDQRQPQALAWDAAGNRLLFSRRTTDSDDDIARVTLGGSVLTLYTNTDVGQSWGVASLDGRVFWTDFDNNRIYVSTSEENKTKAVSVSSGLNAPAGMLSVIQPPEGERSWTKTGSGNWADPENWFYWGRPDTAEEVALFGSAIGSTTTITMDDEITLRGLRFYSEKKYVLGGAGKIVLFPRATETLVSWDPVGLAVDTQPNPWSSSVSDTVGLVKVAPDVTLQTGLSYGGGISPSGVPNCWGGNGFNKGSLDAAVSNGQYYHFAIAPGSGYALSLKSILLNIRVTESTWTAGYVRYQWQYRIGGGAFVSIGTPASLTGTWETNGNMMPLADLTSVPALQNATSPITLRLVAWRADSGSGAFTLNIGRQSGADLVVNGTVAAASTPVASSGVIDVQQGTHEIELPVVLESAVEATSAQDAKLYFKGLLDLNGRTLSVKGAGRFYFSGSFVMRGGRLMTDGEAPLVFSSGSSNTLNGTLEFKPGNGTSLAPGASFNLIDGAAYLGGTFSSVVLPSLPAGLKWDASTLYSNGIVKVVEDPTSLPPAAPGGLTATYAAPNINLSWSAVAAATSYTVKRSSASGGPYTTIASGIAATNYSNLNPAPGTYYYVVCGVNGAGTGANSSQASATVPVPPPGAPTNLSATPVGSQVSLSWSPVSGATNYKIERGTTSGGPYTVIATGITTTSHTDTNLASGTYFYVVSAVNGSGTSPRSSQASASIAPPAPAAPANLTAQAGDGKVTLAWQAVSGAESYTVKVGLSNGGPYVVQSSGVTGTTYVDSNLTNGTMYYYVVTAVNQTGSGPASNQASATPAAPPKPTAAVSRKAHGGAGNFDVAMAVAAGTANPAAPLPVECRLAQVMTLIVTFDKSITSGQATIGAGSASVSGSPSVQGNQMTINLTGVADVQTVRINLKDVEATDGGKLADGVLAFRVILGDVNGDGTVSTSDVNLTRAAVGASLTAQNFRSDVKPDGDVSTSDVNTVRAAVGNSSP